VVRAEAAVLVLVMALARVRLLAGLRRLLWLSPFVAGTALAATFNTNDRLAHPRKCAAAFASSP